MASTAATVFSTIPTVGIDLDDKSSTPAFAVNTTVRANDARLHLYARASEALSSTATILIGTNGSASSDAGSVKGGIINHALIGGRTGHHHHDLALGCGFICISLRQLLQGAAPYFFMQLGEFAAHRSVARA